MLSVRSTSIVPASGSIVIETWIGMPSGSRAERVVHALADDRARRHRRDHVRDPPLGVVEPLLDELRQRLGAVLRAELLRGAPRRSAPRRASPGSRRTTGRARGSGGGTCGSCRRCRGSRAARGRPGRSGCPPRRRRARRACRSSAARCRSPPGAPWRAAVKTCPPSQKTGTRIVWSAGCVLPRYGSLWRKASPSADVVVEVGRRLGQELHADHVHRQALGGREQAVVGGDQRAGEVAGHVQDGRAAGAQQRVLHLAHDRVEPVRDHREQ